MERAAIGKPPRALLDRTEVLPHLAEAFSAFFDLSPGRQIGFKGEGYITAAEIEAYCRLAGIDDPEDRIDMFRMIRAMDGAYLRFKDEQRERDRKDKERSAGRR